MDYQKLLQFLASKPEAEECYPFYPDVPVFKVKGKVFAIASIKDGEPQVNLKCDPAWSDVLRMTFEFVTPGYHMNKKHWNTVFLDKDVPASEIERMVNHSYALIVKSLKKADRKPLDLLYTPIELYGEENLS